MPELQPGRQRRVLIADANHRLPVLGEDAAMRWSHRARRGSAVVLAVGILGLAWLAPSCAIESVSTSADGGAMESDAGNDSGANACPAGQSYCDGKCIGTTEDDKNCGACGNVCSSAKHCAASTCQASKIEHVVLIVQENHTFDAYFGRYCQAPSGSNPSCTSGPSCCERAPDVEPGGTSPAVLDDASNFAEDRNHSQACELLEINGGKMDGFSDGRGPGRTTCSPACSIRANWALADRATVGAYWSYADAFALADRYFQPIVGGTSSNNMYFAVAHFQFLDNAKVPNAIGAPYGCIQGACLDGVPVTFQGQRTIADLLIEAHKTFAVYADGYGDAKAVAPSCESVPSDCPYSPLTHPIAAQACKYDSSDIPFVYYAPFADGQNIKEYLDLKKDIDGASLPNFSYVKAREFHNEHPNVSTITDGIAFVTQTVQMIESSSYASNTLILLTWDEGGGFFDHVAPPPGVDVDDNGKTVPYGTRVPLLALGKFARKGTVSHVQLEHSSIVRFLEYNFIGPVGQLGFNDAKVKNLGSLLDANATGVRIPEQ